jgi:riboflavin synthase
MFSGIVEEVGEVVAVRQTADGSYLQIGAGSIIEDACLGASISVSGACLTIVEFTREWFACEATLETLRCTTLGRLKPGSKINLERAMKLSDRLGGHLVSGHVDAVGKVCAIEEEGFSKLMSFEVTADLAAYFVDKGSVAIEGVSLTVIAPSEPDGKHDTIKFKVALIPHTMQVTTLGELAIGDEVNVETDVIARYVSRWTLPYLSGNLNKQWANH